MKPHYLWLAPLVLALHASGLPAQDPPVRVLTRGQQATRTDLPAVAARPTFPSLAPRSHSSDDGIDSEPIAAKNTFAAPAVTVTSSLAVVLGLFAGLVWLTRKYGSRSIGAGLIPKDVIVSLGSTPIDARTRVTMLRCGGRILVLAQSATGVHPLSEITDPEEVRALTAACLGDSKRSFATTLQSMEKEKSEPGFLGPVSDTPASPRDEGRLFATA